MIVTTFCFVSVKGWAVPSYVQQSTSVLTNTQTNVYSTFTVTSTAGDSIIMSVRFSVGVNLVSIGDSAGDAYTKICSTQTGPTSATDAQMFLYYTSNIPAQVIASSFTISAVGNMQIAMIEVSGNISVDVSTCQSSGDGGASKILASTLPVTTQANDYIASFGSSVGGNGATWSAGPGYTLRSAAATERLVGQDKTVAATGTYFANMTMGTSLVNMMADVAVYGPASPPPGGFNKRLRLERLDE